jgi:hypothetical protein
MGKNNDSIHLDYSGVKQEKVSEVLSLIVIKEVNEIFFGERQAQNKTALVMGRQEKKVNEEK